MILTWNVIKWLLITIVVINEIAALFTVFREKRDIAATWAWLLGSVSKYAKTEAFNCSNVSTDGNAFSKFR